MYSMSSTVPIGWTSLGLVAWAGLNRLTATPRRATARPAQSGRQQADHAEAGERAETGNRLFVAVTVTVAITVAVTITVTVAVTVAGLIFASLII